MNKPEDTGKKIFDIMWNAVGALNHTHIGYAHDHDGQLDPYVDEVLALLAQQLSAQREALLTPTDKKYLEAVRLREDDRSMSYIARKLGYKYSSGVAYLLNNYPRRHILGATS